MNAFKTISLMLAITCVTHATDSITGEQLDAFMKQWSEFKPFHAPMNPADEPLILAALETNPQGPWAWYIATKFSQATYEARDLNETDRRAHYASTLTYLKPAREILFQALEKDTDNKRLQSELSGMENRINLVMLEIGIDLETVEANAKKALAENTDNSTWYYGNVIFNEHTTLGRIALQRGNIDEAKRQLLASGRTPGSPQLNSFGPDFILARELAEKGEFETVIEFLDLVTRFWANPDERSEANTKQVAAEHLNLIEAWKKDLDTGRIPGHRKWR